MRKSAAGHTASSWRVCMQKVLSRWCWPACSASHIASSRVPAAQVSSSSALRPNMWPNVRRASIRRTNSSLGPAPIVVDTTVTSFAVTSCRFFRRSGPPRPNFPCEIAPQPKAVALCIFLIRHMSPRIFLDKVADSASLNEPAMVY